MSQALSSRFNPTRITQVYIIDAHYSVLVLLLCRRQQVCSVVRTGEDNGVRLQTQQCLIAQFTDLNFLVAGKLQIRFGKE